MQFSTLAVAALSIGSTLAQNGQISVHVVTVGNANGSLVYTPNNLVAAKGDMVQFQFMPKNHTVTQSNFDNPCEPIDLHSNVTGIFSGFMPVAATDADIPLYTILINATTPMWLYCSQGKHCQNGMSMVINQNTTANASRSLENYQANAKNVPSSGAPDTGVTDGSVSSTTASGTGAGSGSPSSTSSSGTTQQTASSATAFRAPAALGLAGLLAVGVALFL